MIISFPNASMKKLEFKELATLDVVIVLFSVILLLRVLSCPSKITFLISSENSSPKFGTHFCEMIMFAFGFLKLFKERQVLKFLLRGLKIV